MEHHISNRRAEAQRTFDGLNRLSLEGGDLMTSRHAGYNPRRLANTGDAHVPRLTLFGTDGIKTDKHAPEHPKTKPHKHPHTETTVEHKRNHDAHSKSKRGHEQDASTDLPKAPKHAKREATKAPVESPEQLKDGQIRTAKSSWYDEGTKTASGERFKPDGLTVAHKSLPFGTKVEFTNPDNGRTVVATVNDRGPFIKGREFDLSRGSARQLDMLDKGVGDLKYRVVT